MEILNQYLEQLFTLEFVNLIPDLPYMEIIEFLLSFIGYTISGNICVFKLIRNQIREKWLNTLLQNFF